MGACQSLCIFKHVELLLERRADRLHLNMTDLRDDDDGDAMILHEEDEDHSIWDFTEALSMARGAEMSAKQGEVSGYTKYSQLNQCLSCLLCYSWFICTYFTGPERRRAPKENV
jgi:hypothetical protein